MKQSSTAAKTLLMIALLTAIGCGKSPTEKVQCATPTGKKLYVYGDSISHGFADQGPSYSEQVACALGLTLVQNSIAGTAITSPNQYAQMMSDTWEAGSIVLYSPGVNDSILFGLDATHVTEYTNDLADVVAKMNTSGVRGYIGTPLKTCDQARFNAFGAIDTYTAINEASVSGSVKLIGFQAGMTLSRGNTVDCLHPNKVGHEEMAKIFLSQF